MATKEQPSRQPIPPGVRRRLQQQFEHGSKMSSAGNYDYATEMYTQAVLGDPANPIYMQSFLSNLARKYNNNKSGAKMAGLRTAGSRASMKKSLMQKDWQGVIKSGLEVLKINPWDFATLKEMGQACEALDYPESELELLRMAVDADPKEPEPNRMLGRALERNQDYDGALVCFGRVIEAVKNDEEAMRAMSDLAVKRTIKKGGYEGAETTKDVRARQAAAAGDDDITPEEILLQAVKKDPTDVESYIELHDLYLKNERLQEAEEIVARALEATGGGDLKIRELHEDAQIRRMRHHVTVAEEKARKENSPQSVELFKKMKTELNNKEIEVYGARCDRYPSNLGFKYELGLRMQRAQRFQEAIKLFQEARSDLKRKGPVLAALGDCFYSIKQYRLALNHYEQAIGEISPRDEDILKGAIYKAGRLAEALKQWDKAEKLFTDLAQIDFGYKDVSQRLEEIAKKRDAGGDPDAI